MCELHPRVRKKRSSQAIIIVDRSYYGKIGFIRKVMRTCLLYIPPSWRTAISAISISTPGRRIAYTNDKTTVALCIPRRKRDIVASCEVVIFYPLYSFSFISFLKLFVHEAAHANGADVRRWLDCFKRTLEELYRARTRYSNSYLRFLKREKKMNIDEFWAEIVAASLSNPLRFRRSRPREYTLVKDVIEYTDPDFCIECNYRKLRDQRKELRQNYRRWLKEYLHSGKP